MKTFGDDSPVRPAGRARRAARNVDEWSSVVGNERLTTLAGAVLLVLLLIEVVAAAILRVLMPAHIFAGVLLAGPLIVKMGSTGYRFLRYYTRSPAYVRKGPPRLALRVLALLATSSGIGLVLTLPRFNREILPSPIGLNQHQSLDTARGPMSRSVSPGKPDPFLCAPQYGASSRRHSERNRSVRKGCAPLRASTLPLAFVDAALAKHASAFTQGNDLPWNRQTLFRFEGAEQAVFSIAQGRA